jgi:hypothetical protein
MDARTRRRVWEMSFDVTEHAGGAGKNRVADTTIRLEPGDYIAHYVTDDSHAAGDWNASPPPNGKLWGLTLLAASGNAPGADVVAPYEPKADPSIVATLVGVRDDRHERSRFALEREQDVRVYAIGEGSDGEMFDYAWIEEARTGRRVWEMRFDETEHAGGAEKNRQLDRVVRLAAGEYILHYQTDDSHSFGDWNDDPPMDRESWGVTLFKVSGRKAVERER